MSKDNIENKVFDLIEKEIISIIGELGDPALSLGQLQKQLRDNQIIRLAAVKPYEIAMALNALLLIKRKIFVIGFVAEPTLDVLITTRRKDGKKNG